MVSAAAPEHLEKFGIWKSLEEFQEPPVEEKQEEDVSGADSALSEGASDTVGLEEFLKKDWQAFWL